MIYLLLLILVVHSIFILLHEYRIWKAHRLPPIVTRNDIDDYKEDMKKRR